MFPLNKETIVYSNKLCNLQIYAEHNPYSLDEHGTGAPGFSFPKATFSFFIIPHSALVDSLSPAL